jgi:hypothetical protein
LLTISDTKMINFDESQVAHKKWTHRVAWKNGGGCSRGMHVSPLLLLLL